MTPRRSVRLVEGLWVRATRRWGGEALEGQVGEMTSRTVVLHNTSPFPYFLIRRQWRFEHLPGGVWVGEEDV